MRVQFLLGPAGSGKTFRCLAQIRAALQKNPAGAPLVFLAPKQATFQIERQLLADSSSDSLSGFTRLHIFSFERLAQFVFEKLNLAPPKILSAGGRVMVLRALLARHERDLKLFHRSARRTGFALELSSLLAELQQHQFTPQKLRALAETKKLRNELKNKLRDLALLLEHYENWLREQGLRDANHLLDFATGALRAEFKDGKSKLKIENLFLDGFAEMTPQELDFLAALMPFCAEATLAFCLETDVKASSLSIWSAIGKTFQQCRERLENLPDCKIETELLLREPDKNRFSKNPELAHLEKNWADSKERSGFEIQNPAPAFRVVECQTPEAEVTFAAREVLKFVRAGNRFRDCAVLVRSLDGYHQPLARIFRRYNIPFFLDRRESVAHHPLAELTRSVLRTVAFDWRHEDWFAALKAGFCTTDETEIDRLENAALEYGWHGKKWLEPLTDESFERLRKRILPPFENCFGLFSKINFQPDGAQLADFIRELWSDLNIQDVLQQWTADETKSAIRNPQSAIHLTVWEQMNAWLENLALAFPHETLPLREWLPILEAGLANLTVGVIPPSLDEVLVGAIDRARNPALKMVLVLGVNESVFPAPPAAPVILTNNDRDELERENITFGPDIFEQISREHYLGYIACTRADEKLIVTFSRQNAEGKARNPSPFIARLQKIFPILAIEEFSGGTNWHEAESANELIPALVKIQQPAAANENWRMLLELPALKGLTEKLSSLCEPDEAENLPPELAEKIYSPILRSSVSRLEEFAQCPFRFFVHSGLRADERKIFELDARERGSFQHEVLKEFHESLVAENKFWRDLVPSEARQRIADIAAQLALTYRDGLLQVDAQSRFDARILTGALQEFVGTLVAWMRGQYKFDPAQAELSFGFPDSLAPAWQIELDGGHRLALRGKIDRIDVCREGDSVLAVVTDYKSSQKKLDKILVANGIQLQLLAYLAAIRSWPAEIFDAKQIEPAGVFYVNLRGQFEGGGSRAEILTDADEAQRLAYRHSGRFDANALDKLDSIKAHDQFNYRLTNAGKIYANSPEALERKNFQELLDGVETQLREMGGRIFSGAAQVDPYRKGNATACDYCKYKPACRIDKWTHSWRVLHAEKVEKAD